MKKTELIKLIKETINEDQNSQGTLKNDLMYVIHRLQGFVRLIDSRELVDEEIENISFKINEILGILE